MTVRNDVHTSTRGKEVIYDSGWLDLELRVAHATGLVGGFLADWRGKLQKEPYLRKTLFEIILNEYTAEIKNRIECYTAYAGPWAEIKKEPAKGKALKDAWAFQLDFGEIENEAWIRRIDLSNLKDRTGETDHDNISRFVGDMLVFGFLYLLLKAAEAGLERGEFRLARGEANPYATRGLYESLMIDLISVAPNHVLKIIRTSPNIPAENEREMENLISVCRKVGVGFEDLRNTHPELYKNHFFLHSECNNLVFVEDWNKRKNSSNHCYHTLISNSDYLHSVLNAQWEGIIKRL